MKIIKLYEDVEKIIGNPYLYHVTEKSKLPIILSNGLKPEYKGMVFLSYSLEAARSWATALTTQRPIILKFKLQDCLPFYMRDFVYTTPAKMWKYEPKGPGDREEMFYALHGDKKGEAGKLVKIETLDELKDWLETIEAYGVDVHKDQVSNYDMLEVMVNRTIPPSAIVDMLALSGRPIQSIRAKA